MQKRSNVAVKVGEGVNASRIRTEGRGQHNGTAAGRHKNRRVDADAVASKTGGR